MKSKVIYAIIIYVIFMVIMVVLKPSFIYDHDKSKFKEFGFKKNKSFLSIGSVGIFAAFFIAILLVFLGKSDNEKEDKIPNIQYVQVPVPQYIQPMPQVIYQQVPVQNLQSMTQSAAA